MNKRGNAILLRIYSILHDIPGANLDGASSQSTSFEGIATFAKDMSAIKEPLADAIHHVRVGEYEEAEWFLAAIENWIKMRKEANWQNVFPFPQPRTQRQHRPDFFFEK